VAKTRYTAAALARVFRQCEWPAYAIDDEQQICFVNDACSAWLGMASEVLIGRSSRFHSSPELTGPDAVAASLCPPPEVWAGRSRAGTLLIGTPPERFAAEFLRFTADGQSVGIIAIVTPSAIAEEPQPAESDDSPREAQQLHERVRRYQQLMAGRSHVDRFVGPSPTMLRVREQIRVAGQTACGVLITGPEGSGRETVARAIHYHARSLGKPVGPLVPLDAALLSVELFEQAVRLGQMRPGNESGIGTLLIEDVDALPIEVETAVLEFLDATPGRWRLVASAQLPPENWPTDSGPSDRFVSRVSTIAVELTPLPERPEDLPLLVQALIEERNARSRKQLTGCTPEAMDLLAAYPWPGDVQELHEIITEAHNSAAGHLITARDLPRPIHQAQHAALFRPAPPETIDLEGLLAKIENQLIRRALEIAEGNKSKAAELLGMTRPKLYRRLEQLGLE
jgi:DNA-binding NtrC family response regulator